MVKASAVADTSMLFEPDSINDPTPEANSLLLAVLLLVLSYVISVGDILSTLKFRTLLSGTGKTGLNQIRNVYDLMPSSGTKPKSVAKVEGMVAKVILLDIAVPLEETTPLITAPFNEFVSCAPAIVVAQSTALVAPGTITRLLNLKGALSSKWLATVVPSSFTVKVNTGVPKGVVKVESVEGTELDNVKVVAKAVVVVEVAIAGLVNL